MNVISPHVLPTRYKESYHTIPPIIPITSHTPRLHQHVSRSPMARRHANALAIKTSQIRMALRHHERNSPHGLPINITRYRQSSRSPATRRVYTNVFRAPQWHGGAQTHFLPRPRISAWHCDITDVIRHTVCPHTRSNPITRCRQSSPSPATRRVYSMFRTPQWHGATQTHFPPRPRNPHGTATSRT